MIGPGGGAGGDSAPERRLLELITGGWTTQALHTAVVLGLPELLADGPRTEADLAGATGAHPPSLTRLLRALTTLDIVAEAPAGTFGLTVTGAALGSLDAWARWWGGYAWPEWGRLPESVATGERSRRFSVDDDAEAAAVFGRAMAQLTRLSADAVVRRYDFSRFAVVADIGGGYGELLASILGAHPTTRGVLFDRPDAVDGARRHLDGAGVGDRADVVAGDVFDSAPEGADAYVLKSVLHDFDDADASRILESVRRAMALTATLVLVERVVPDRLEATPEHRSLACTDLHMLVAHGAGERTEAQFRDLLEAAGFDLRRIVAAELGLSVLEATPAEVGAVPTATGTPSEPPAAGGS